MSFLDQEGLVSSKKTNIQKGDITNHTQIITRVFTSFELYELKL